MKVSIDADNCLSTGESQRIKVSGSAQEYLH